MVVRWLRLGGRRNIIWARMEFSVPFNFLNGTKNKKGHNANIKKQKVPIQQMTKKVEYAPLWLAGQHTHLARPLWKLEDVLIKIGK